MEHTTFERTVPEGYSLTYHIDAADKKTGVLLTLGSLVIAAAVLFVIFRNARLISLNIDKMISYDLTLLGSLLIYIVLHELTHVKDQRAEPLGFALFELGQPIVLSVNYGFSQNAYGNGCEDIYDGMLLYKACRKADHDDQECEEHFEKT